MLLLLLVHYLLRHVRELHIGSKYFPRKIWPEPRLWLIALLVPDKSSLAATI